MKKELEHIKSKGRTVVYVVISVNAAVSVFLIAAMVYSLTRITQQQEEIMNLRSLVQKLEQIKPQSSKQEAAEDVEEEKGLKIERDSNTVAKEKKYPEENDQADIESVNTDPLVSNTAIPSKRKCCGVRGKRGKHGQKGEKGDRGYQGEKGDRGEEGREGREGRIGITGRDGVKGKDGKKGEKGSNGIPGPKGMKGERGLSGRKTVYSESIHLVGIGKKIKLTADVERITSWKLNHKCGEMNYLNGHVSVGVNGFYYIYSQMYYYAKTAIMGHMMKIGDREVLKSVYSVSKDHPYKTQYIGGVFNISKGQSISVSVPFTKAYYFDAESSYFGAFMVHGLE